MIKGFGNMYWKTRETIQSGAVKCSQIWWNLDVSDWLEICCELVVVIGDDSYYTTFWVSQYGHSYGLFLLASL